MGLLLIKTKKQSFTVLRFRFFSKISSFFDIQANYSIQAWLEDSNNLLSVVLCTKR